MSACWVSFTKTEAEHPHCSVRPWKIAQPRRLSLVVSFLPIGPIHHSFSEQKPPEPTNRVDPWEKPCWHFQLLNCHLRSCRRPRRWMPSCVSRAGLGKAGGPEKSTNNPELFPRWTVITTPLSLGSVFLGSPHRRREGHEFSLASYIKTGMGRKGEPLGSHQSDGEDLGLGNKVWTAQYGNSTNHYLARVCLQLVYILAHKTGIGLPFSLICKEGQCKLLISRLLEPKVESLWNQGTL